MLSMLQRSSSASAVNTHPSSIRLERFVCASSVIADRHHHTAQSHPDATVSVEGKGDQVVGVERPSWLQWL